jgi:hypothetical protein
MFLGILGTIHTSLYRVREVHNPRSHIPKYLIFSSLYTSHHHALSQLYQRVGFFCSIIYHIQILTSDLVHGGLDAVVRRRLLASSHHFEELAFGASLRRNRALWVSDKRHHCIKSRQFNTCQPADIYLVSWWRYFSKSTSQLPYSKNPRVSLA